MLKRNPKLKKDKIFISLCKEEIKNGCSVYQKANMREKNRSIVKKKE